MRIALIALLIALGIPSGAMGQTTCFQFSPMLSCDGPSGNTTITPLGRTGGVITQDGYGYSSLEPYTIIGAPDRRERRGYNLDLEPLKPLPTLRRQDYDDPYMGLPGLDLPGLELP